MHNEYIFIKILFKKKGKEEVKKKEDSQKQERSRKREKRLTGKGRERR
jgi:hypothetical protein